MERWLPIEEYPEYCVSDQGRVRRDGRDKILRISVATGGNPFVSLSTRNGQVRKGLALLVARAFVPLPPYRCDTPTPIHLDGDQLNCCADNLQWRPRWFAQKYARQFNQHLDNDNAVRNIDTDRVYNDVWEVVFEHGVLFNDVVKSIINKTYVYPLYERFEWVDPE